ncbi:adenylate cyclase type 2-like isoform X2 [Daphnia carinata]|uniref:adenylate cyclase type 2-like isoform X2 n=1 Tax=Daphnia carinata TaxID=120202 RepID=UPI002580003E|nr:adenylate cyclase type 2-like isoform X2 [Daphnia carinata]
MRDSITDIPNSNNNDMETILTVRGMELVARSSIHSLRPPSITSASSSNGQDAYMWKLTDLRKRFKNKDLEILYDRYQQRLMHVDFKAFLLLQIFLSVIFIILLLIFNVDDESKAVPEIIGHLVLLLTACLFYYVAYREEHFKKYRFLHLLMALTLAFLLVTVDIGLYLWFAKQNETHSSEEIVFHIPAALYTILAVYNLLPIASFRVAILIGLTVGIVHVIASVLLFQTRIWTTDHGINIAMIVADVAFYLTANVFGIFTKCLNETTLRRVFLDRRRCIESTIKLDYEKSQEEQLMLSILPKHIAHDVGTAIREEVQQMIKQKSSPSSRRPFDTLHVETHPEVSVLYADIVNFTPLTSALPSGSLVSLLNELFGKFDEAARENDCLRIKILGDCYYCVSGIPDSTSDHAKNCVEMGFKMIEIIRQVREDHQVDVDMRIGVHSGSVISGLIGLRKWQFDIWSRDVTIANHMEQSGIAGGIHISMATKNLLGSAYRFEPGNGKRRDAYLAKLGIETFLVVSADSDQSKNGGIKKIKFNTDPFATLPRINTSTSFRRSPPLQRMNSQSKKTLNDSDSSSLDSLYEKVPPSLPVILYQRNPPTTSLPHIYAKVRQVSLAVGDEQPEEIYSRLVKNPRRSSATSTTVARLIAKRRSTAGENTTRRGAVLMDNTLVSFRRMMDQADSKMEKAIESMRLSKIKAPRNQEVYVNILLLFSNRNWELPFLRRPDPLFNLYVLGAIPVLFGIMTIQLALYNGDPRAFWLVFGVAMIVVIVIALCLWIPQLWNRPRNTSLSELDEILGSLSASPEPSRSSSTVSAIFSKLDFHCSSLMARISIFLLVNIIVGACGLVDLSIVLGSNNSTLELIGQNGTLASQCDFYDPRIYLWKFRSREECLLCTASPSIIPEVDHALYLFTILMVLHVADRQIEFIYRLDYVWQRQLVSEQEEANITRIVNKVLLQNILPLHVAEVYLDTSRCSDQLYHEEHKHVAVMFACIPNFMDYYTDNDVGDGGLHCIEVLNSIISAFDALSYEESFARIEKIKIVGSTYMAASGLTAVRKGSTETVTETQSYVSSLVIMVKFASAMATVLERLNRKQSHQFGLRTGIEYGPVIAGVVGAQKPLYDIWGDTVNMASRLEYTSQVGEIQVTEKTARLLEAEGIRCEKRGETFLKGKGLVMTYWIRPDEVEFNGSVRGSLAAVKGFIGLSDMLVPASVRNSFSRQPVRQSVLFEEEEEEHVHREFQGRYSLSVPGRIVFPSNIEEELCQDVDSLGISNENCTEEEEITYL